MRKLTTLLIILAVPILAGFTIDIEQIKIWTEQTSIAKAIDFEKSLSQKNELLEMNVSLSKSIYPLIDNFEIAKPVIFKREQTSFLPLYAEYFYSK